MRAKISKISITYTESETDAQNPGNSLLINDLTRSEERKERRENIAMALLGLTLAVYIWLGCLQSNANALTARSLKNSHAPWISVHDLLLEVRGGDISLHYAVENYSDSPALNVKVVWTNVANSGQVIAINQIDPTEKSKEGTCYMPRQVLYMSSNSFVTPSSRASECYEDIMGGQYTMVLTTTYDDISGRHFETICSVVHDPKNNNYAIEGLKLIPPSDF